MNLYIHFFAPISKRYTKASIGAGHSKLQGKMRPENFMKVFEATKVC